MKPRHPSHPSHLYLRDSPEHIFSQIISTDTNSETIIQNVPDELATEIPRSLLLGFSNDSGVIDKLNKKKWKQQQVGDPTPGHTVLLACWTLFDVVWLFSCFRLSCSSV